MKIQDLYDSNCFIINLDRCPERYKFAKENIAAAGFNPDKTHRFNAIDAKKDDLKAAWAKHGSPAFDKGDTEFTVYTGKQGCMLSHLDLWKFMINNNIKVATVFEDDVCFHKDWKTLAPAYLDITPGNFELLYLGGQIDYMMDGNVIMTPTFCTHAYVITLEGAKKLYKLLTECPRGVATIDCMLLELMKQVVFGGVEPPHFIWYTWNAIMFPDPFALADPDWAKRNTGLVFQDPKFVSDVRIWK
jgi:GR25 family glycosyltransferase involved in LPS biosynthesis